MKEYKISRAEEGQRFDKYISKILSQAPKSFGYKMLRKKNITLNGKKADGSEKLAAGDVVRFFLADDTFAKFATDAPSPVNIANAPNVGNLDKSMPELNITKSGLKVLYEDTDILAFHKPVGLLSQKAAPQDISVNDYLLQYYAQKTEEATTFKPSVCNRLDRNTSGIILCGMSMNGSQELSRMLKDRSLRKFYRCIVLGNVQEDHLSGYIRKDERTNQVIFRKDAFADASPIETSWKPLSQFQVLGKNCTELEVHLITGKTHQIRAHLAGIGHPLLGDFKYGNQAMNTKLKAKFGISSQLLHAYRVEFPALLPALQSCENLTITDPVPENFMAIRG